MRLATKPLSFVLEIGVLVDIDSLVRTSSFEVAAVVIDEYTILKVWLIIFLDSPFEIADELSAFFCLVDLDKPLRKLIFEFDVQIGAG